MPALVLAKVKIDDAAACREHVSRSGPAVMAFGSRRVVRGAPPERPKGEDDSVRMVIVEVPGIEAVRASHNSQQHTEARAFRAPPGSAVPHRNPGPEK